MTRLSNQVKEIQDSRLLVLLQPLNVLSLADLLDLVKGLDSIELAVRLQPHFPIRSLPEDEAGAWRALSHFVAPVSRHIWHCSVASRSVFQHVGRTRGNYVFTTGVKVIWRLGLKTAGCFGVLMSLKISPLNRGLQSLLPLLLSSAQPSAGSPQPHGGRGRAPLPAASPAWLRGLGHCG